MVQGSQGHPLVQDLQDFPSCPIDTDNIVNEGVLLTCCVFQSNLITVKLLIMNYVVRHNLHFLQGPLALLDDPSALAVLGLPGEWGNDYRTSQLLNLR